MAKDKVQVDIVTSTKKSVKSLATFTAAIATAVVVVTKFFKVINKLEEAYAVQERAETKLRAAIRATGKEASISAGNIFQLASELQKTTKIGDELTISAAAMLQQLADLNQEGLEKTIPLMQDFAKAMGISLETAATLIGKTIGSTTNALVRYGVVIDTSGTKSERLAEVIDQLEEKFGGMAAMLGKTATAVKEGLNAAWGDLQETLGGMVSNYLIPIREEFTKLIEKINTSITQARVLKQVLAGLIGGEEALTVAIAAQEVVVQKIADAYDKWKEKADLVGDTDPFGQAIDPQNKADEFLNKLSQAKQTLFNLQAALDELQGEDGAPPVPPTPDTSLDKLNAMYLEVFQTEEDLIRINLEWLKGLENTGVMTKALIKHYENLLIPLAATGSEFEKVMGLGTELSADWIAAQEVIQAATKALEENEEAAKKSLEAQQEGLEKLVDTYENQFIAAMSQVGAAIASGEEVWKVFARAGLDAIAAIVDALALELGALAVKYTAMSIAGDLSKIPAAVAATLGVAGLAATAGAIRAIPLAEGGIVTKPTMALIGEAGPEAVVPLGKMGGGKTVVINFNGGLVHERQIFEMVRSMAARV